MLCNLFHCGNRCGNWEAECGVGVLGPGLLGDPDMSADNTGLISHDGTAARIRASAVGGVYK